MADSNTAKSAESLENKLNDIFVKNAPFQIPENGRKWIAQYAWVFELIFVVLGAFTFIALLGLLGVGSALATATGVAGFVGYQLMLAWVALLVLGAEVVIGGMAIPKLKATQKAGWQLAYYVALFSLGYGLVNALARGSFFSLIGQVVGSAIGLYILFQVRSYFKN